MSNLPTQSNVGAQPEPVRAFFADLELSKGTIIKQKNGPINPTEQPQDERLSRIVAAALEVFSESSFRDATTDEIARRAHVSKRDIYAAFPNKHAILLAVIDMVLQADEQKLLKVILLTREAASLQDRLEVIGLALINEILSPATGFLSRLIATESILQPHIGSIYFERWYTRRANLISQLLSVRSKGATKDARPHNDASQAAKHYLALITHLPQLTVSVGVRDMWNSRSAQAHVHSSVECFLSAHRDLVLSM